MIDKKIYEKVMEITGTDYGFELVDEKYEVDFDALESMIEDLLYLIEALEEKYKDLEQDIEYNYRPIPYEEQIGYNPKDFY